VVAALIPQLGARSLAGVQSVIRKMAMIEILDNFWILKKGALDLSELSLSGVKFGSDISDFPMNKVSEITLAPIVKGSSWSVSEGSRYYDEDDNELSKEAVIDNVVEEGGVLHFEEKISFFIRNGKVCEFSIYGAHKNHFDYIKSFEHFENEFGVPDSKTTSVAYGDIMDHKCFYKASRKLVVWNVGRKDISAILLGHDENV